MFGVRVLAVAAAVVVMLASKAQSDPMTVLEYMKSVKRVAADTHLSYGPAPQQTVDLFLPKSGKGPYPVVVLMHGGCFSNEVPASSMSAPAADLAAHGVAVWNIEYRRLGDQGGGYPGTYQDVGSAVDALRKEAPLRNLDLSRVLFVGHSSGGVLSLWAAGRRNITKTSPLYVSDPFMPGGVIALSAMGDLKGFAPLMTWICGDDFKAESLVGKPSPERPDPYADTSPRALLPLATPQLAMTGVYDSYLPPFMSLWWRIQARRKGDQAENRVVENAGHFDVVSTETAAWPVVRDAILEKLPPAVNTTKSVKD